MNADLRERVARAMTDSWKLHGDDDHAAEAAIRVMLEFLPGYFRRDGRKYDRFLSGWESAIVEGAVAELKLESWL